MATRVLSKSSYLPTYPSLKKVALIGVALLAIGGLAILAFYRPGFFYAMPMQWKIALGGALAIAVAVVAYATFILYRNYRDNKMLSKLNNHPADSLVYAFRNLSPRMVTKYFAERHAPVWDEREPRVFEPQEGILFKHYGKDPKWVNTAFKGIGNNPARIEGLLEALLETKDEVLVGVVSHLRGQKKLVQILLKMRWDVQDALFDHLKKEEIDLITANKFKMPCEDFTVDKLWSDDSIKKTVDHYLGRWIQGAEIQSPETIASSLEVPLREISNACMDTPFECYVIFSVLSRLDEHFQLLYRRFSQEETQKLINGIFEKLGDHFNVQKEGRVINLVLKLSLELAKSSDDVAGPMSVLYLLFLIERHQNSKLMKSAIEKLSELFINKPDELRVVLNSDQAQEGFNENTWQHLKSVFPTRHSFEKPKEEGQVLPSTSSSSAKTKIGIDDPTSAQ